MASTSTASTRMPRRAAISARAAAMVVLPVPPLPATKITRLRRRSSRRVRPPARWGGVRASQAGSAPPWRAASTSPACPCGLTVRHSRATRPSGPIRNGGAIDAHVGAPVLRLGDPELEEVDEAAIRIADQRDAQLALGGEGVVALAGVRRDAVYGHPGALELGQQPGELLPLQGAARRVVLRVEVEHGPAPEEVGVAGDVRPHRWPGRSQAARSSSHPSHTPPGPPVRGTESTSPRDRRPAAAERSALS